jgi:hypothetical protein
VGPHPTVQRSDIARAAAGVFVALWITMILRASVSLRVLTIFLIIPNDGVVTPFLVVVAVFDLIVRRWIVIPGE